ncbi:MAG: DUF2844 domain-containing protein [Terracidiphilus sp.]|jgi:hypothetical protein
MIKIRKNSLSAYANLRSIAIAGLILGMSLPAMASLGGNISSIDLDRTHMNASEEVTGAGLYSVHRLQVPGGTVVNEYASPGGTIFAVTWQGQFPPDMQQILGVYFQQYSVALAAQAKHYGHQPLNIQSSGLVVQTGGHMRAHWGRVYVQGLIPTRVSADLLQ